MAFGAVAVSTVFNLTDNMVLVLPVTIIAAILLLKGGSNGKIKGDASITMMSVGAMAFGYLVMNVFSSGSNLCRRCMYHPVRLHFNTYFNKGKSDSLCYTVNICNICICTVL